MPEEQEMGERHEPESRALRGYRLGSVWGVPIAVDWSLLVIFALVTFDLGAGVFPSWHPSWSPVVVWTTAFCAAVLFFGSLLLHELSHALMARGFGIRVRGITLFLFGGVTQLAREAGAPKTEFFVAIVGPLTSLVLGGTAWVIGMRTAGPALGEAIANGDEPPTPFFGTVKNPVRMMMTEHETAGEMLAELRVLTNGYELPADACTSYRILYQRLGELEGDLHRHIHLENNVLFPRALSAEETVPAPQFAVAAGSCGGHCNH